MANRKDRMTIFPEEKSGEAGKPAAGIAQSQKQPGKTGPTSLGKQGQKSAKDFSNDQDRQTLGGKMDQEDR